MSASTTALPDEPMRFCIRVKPGRMITQIKAVSDAPQPERLRIDYSPDNPDPCRDGTILEVLEVALPLVVGRGESFAIVHDAAKRQIILFAIPDHDRERDFEFSFTQGASFPSSEAAE